MTGALQRAGRIKSTYARNKEPREQIGPDFLIGARAIKQAAAFLTANFRPFRHHFDGLQLLVPSLDGAYFGYFYGVLNSGPLASVAQPGRNAIDGNMNPALYPLVGLARPVAAHQLYLQVVQGVDVGEAVTDGALQRCVIC